MAHNEFLADRIRQVLDEKKAVYTEKKMFGGLCFMVDGKMCIGIMGNDDLMARIGPEKYEEALTQPGCKEMTFTGRSMKGFVFLEDEAFDQEEDLARWVQLCLDFNPLAKATKKKRKKKT